MGDAARQPSNGLQLLRLAQLIFNLLLRRDIAPDRRRPDNSPLRVVNRRNRDRHMQSPAILGHSHRLEVFDLLALADLLKNPGDFIRPIGRTKYRNISADNLRSRVAVNLLCAFVPLRNNTVEILADNGILRRIHNQRQTVLGIAQLASLPSLQFLVRPPQFLLDSYSITDVADDAQDYRAVPRRYRTETDLYWEFRPILAPTV